MQTIEKGQGVTLGSSPGNYAEDKIVDTLRRVKAIDPNISTIFYYNSILGQSKNANAFPPVLPLCLPLCASLCGLLFVDRAPWRTAPPLAYI